MGDYYNQGHSGKLHPVISLKRYSDALVAYEREKEKEDTSSKSFINNWKKVAIQNTLGMLLKQKPKIKYWRKFRNIQNQF